MSGPVLSVVVATHNEQPQILNQTIASIRNTGGPWVEIVIVDDCSQPQVFVKDPAVKLIRTPKRLGVGPARHIGVEAASTPLIVLTDAHVVFLPNWLPPTLDVLAGSEKLLLCGECLALDENHNDVEHPIGRYTGGRMVVYDPNEELRWRVLSAKWAKDKPGQDFYHLSAVMGAAYGFHKSFFLKIGGLRMLREFGNDEEYLSIKTMMAGGDIRMFKSLKIGHRFRSKTAPPYRITLDMCLYNTLLMIHTCCPFDVAKDLAKKVGPGSESINAKDMIFRNRDEIDAERERLKGVFTRSWEEYIGLISIMG